MKQYLLIWNINALRDCTNLIFNPKTEVLPVGNETTVIECKKTEEIQSLIQEAEKEIWGKVMEKYKNNKEEYTYVPFLIQVLAL